MKKALAASVLLVSSVLLIPVILEAEECPTAVDEEGREGDPACVTAGNPEQLRRACLRRATTAVYSFSQFLKMPLRVNLRF